jgi:hypothetical protein
MKKSYQAQGLPAIESCVFGALVYRRGMLFSRLVLIPHLRWSPVFGSASRPAGRCGIREADPPPSPKSIPHRRRRLSPPLSRRASVPLAEGSGWGVIDIPARFKHSSHAFLARCKTLCPSRTARAFPMPCAVLPESAPRSGHHRRSSLSDSMVYQTTYYQEPITKKKAPSEMLGACEKRVRRKWRLLVPWTRPV